MNLAVTVAARQRQRRPRRARQVRRARASLVGPGERVQAAARHQSAAPRLDRATRRRPRRQARASTSAAAAASSPKRWRARRPRDAASTCRRKALGVARLHRLESRRRRRLPARRRRGARRRSARARSTSSPAWSCSSTCPSRRRRRRVRRAGAGPAGLRRLLDASTAIPKSYLFAIVGAEYLLRLLPRGTHDWTRFIKPVRARARCARARASTSPASPA